MDHRRALAALLTLVAVSAANPLPIREANWIALEARVSALTSEPAGCVSANEDTIQSVSIGTAAFRTPFLLGGQAARAGLSCASCHQNGRGNPHFVFPGISGAPGTADVTASILSSHRGDGTFNPRPIPDLAIDPPKISRAPASGDLRRFIRGLIVEEFDGSEPPARVLDGLVAYTRATNSRNCAAFPRDTTLDTSLQNLGVALHAAVDAQHAGDTATARLMTLAARSELGRIDERFAGRKFAKERAKLDLYDQALQGNLRLVDSGSDAESAFADATLMVALIRQDLAALETKSLYNPKLLKRALAR